MVDVRQKGARAETVIRDTLRTLTGLKWERTPGSGALDEKHGLKGDLYLPNEKNVYAVECKHYADDYLTSQLLSGKNPQLIEWWEQAKRQGVQVSRKPLLIFKFNRSKIFVAYEDMPLNTLRYLFVNVLGHEFYVSLLDEWVKYEEPKFI